MGKKTIDNQDDNLDSLEDLMEEELEFADEDGPEASSDFKALFDDLDADEDPEDEEEDELYLGEKSAYLDDEGLSMDELDDLELDEDSEEEDFLDLEMDKESDDFGDDDDDLEASANDTEAEESESLSDAFASMSGDTEGAEDSELGVFESAEIEELEFVDNDSIISIVESMLFSTDKPIGIATIKKAFEGTSVKSEQIRRAIETLEIDYASSQRGVSLEEIAGGYQLRTKLDNMKYLKRISKGKPFKLSGPALEVLSIVAYKQPVVKAEVDEIRGVESGHLMRALMDRSLIRFAGKSELPGKPMYYETSRKFLEIFGLRALKELPSLSEIDELIPEGIGGEEEKAHLSSVTDSMSIDAISSYSEGADELEKIEETLGMIDTTTEFFEQEKLREKARQEKMRAETIREAIEFGELVESKDQKWLEKYEQKLIDEEEARIALAAKQALEEEERAIAAEELTNAESTESLSTNNVDKSSLDNLENLTDFIDESEELFANSDEAEAPRENESALVSEDESSLIFAEDTNEKTNSLNLKKAFGDLTNAFEAFEKDDTGVSVDELGPEEEQDIVVIANKVKEPLDLD